MHALALLLAAPALSPPVAVRCASPAELADSSLPLFESLSSLVATAQFEPKSPRETAVMTRATREALVDGFAGAGRRQQNAVGRSAVLLATAGDGSLVGAVGLQVLALTRDGRGERLMSELSAPERRQLTLRPLLSNLAVEPRWRRRGVATELLRESELLARRWGFDELLLLVLQGNAAARTLYETNGYETAGAPLEGERPAPAVLRRGVRWVSCTNVCMRKPLLEAPVARAGG